MAGADQGQADPPPVPALRDRAPGRGLPRATGALFRRTSRWRARRSGTGSRRRQGVGRPRTDRDRSGGRFRALRRHGLRLTPVARGPRSPHHAKSRGKERPMAKLRHIAIIVEDPEKSAKFFEQAFDMKRAGEARRGIYMTDGIFNVALLKKENDKEQLGLYHFGMWVDDLD